MAVIHAAIEHGDLPWSEKRNEDFFTECAMLQMQLLRPVGAWQQAIDTRLRMTAEHPCDTLRTSVSGTTEQKTALPPVVSYYHYPYGARHIEALALSVMSYRHAARLYSFLSYGALALLLAAMILRDRRLGLALAPIPIMLAFAFSLHRFGGNLAHAPGYILGWLALALFVAKPLWFGSFARRVAFFVFIGFLTIYTDLLSGTIPTLLALTIVLNHFFYVAGSSNRHLADTIINGLTIVTCFIVAWAILNGLRLEALVAEGMTDQGRPIFGMYWHGLATRTGTDAGLGTPLSYFQTMTHLLAARFQMALGGPRFAEFILGSATLCWLWTALTLARRARWTMLPQITDIAVLAIASFGIFAWYWLFMQHTYVHVLFMVRMLALPAGFGIAAAALTWLAFATRPQAITAYSIR